MKNRIVISVLCICMLLTVSGCGAGVEDEVPSDDNSEPPVITESDQEEQTESDDDHESIAGNDAEESEDYDSGSVTTTSEGDTDAESKKPSDDNSEPTNSELPVITESEQGEPTEPRDYYGELIAAATECIVGKNEGETEDDEDYEFRYSIYENYGFSYMIYLSSFYTSMKLGYLIEDIDGNGTEELIFGQNDESGSLWDGVIYDLYTISDGELVHVFSGLEKYRYYFCENGLIANERENGFAESIYSYYSFEGAELHLEEAVIFSEWDDIENPWFYLTQSDSIYDTESRESVSEEQARKIIKKYVYEHPVFTPFVEE